MSLAGAAAAIVLVGIPTWHDGDSGRIGRERIRLAAVDAPELRHRLPDGRDPSAVLIREGLARPDMRFGGRRYVKDELVARAGRRGVWR